MAHVSKSDGKKDINHLNFIQWNPFQIRFNFFIVKCPINFNYGNCRMRKDGLIWIQIKCTSTQQRRNLIVSLRNFLIDINITTIATTTDKLKNQMTQKKDKSFFYKSWEIN